VEALGKISDMAPPSKECDVQLMLSILPPLLGDISDFVSTARMRDDEQIRDGQEQIYQAHWTVRDAALNNRKAPDGLDVGVTSERHVALNWLLYSDGEWDEVAIDT
jgi:hypothetical protein